MFNQWLGKQLSNPRGILAKWIGSYMEKGNKKANGWTVELINPSPGDRILEIGMGTGTTLNRLLNEYEDIEKICGIDISLSMVNKAKQVNRGFIASHKAEITEGNVEHIPFAAEYFTKVYTIHTVYFWSDLVKGLQEIQRVLKPEGEVFITFTLSEELDRMRHTKEFLHYSPKYIQSLLGEEGFRQVKISVQKPFCCISAIKE